MSRETLHTSSISLQWILPSRILRLGSVVLVHLGEIYYSSASLSSAERLSASGELSSDWVILLSQPLLARLAFPVTFKGIQQVSGHFLG